MQDEVDAGRREVSYGTNWHFYDGQLISVYTSPLPWEIQALDGENSFTRSFPTNSLTLIYVQSDFIFIHF